MASINAKIKIDTSDVKKAFGTIETESKSTGKVIDKNLSPTIDTKEITGAFDKIKEQVKGIGANLKGSFNFGDMLSFGAGGLIASGVTAGLGLIKEGFTQVIEKGAEFEKQLNAVGAVTGQSGEALAKIGESALELSTTFGGDVNVQLGAFQGILSKFGAQLAETPQYLNEVTKNVNLLAKAGGIDATQAMNSLTDVMMQFGINVADGATAAKESARFMNLLAASAQVGSAEIAEVAQSMLQVGVGARAAGVSAEETTSAIQILAGAGKKGSEAGISLRNVLMSLQKQSGEGDKVLEKMGLTTAKLGASLGKDGLEKTVLKLKDGLKGFGTQTEKNQALMTLFGVESSTVGILLEKSGNQFGEFTKAMTGTNSGVEQAKINMQGFSESMSRLQANVDKYLIKTFVAVKSVIVSVFDGISIFLNNTFLPYWEAIFKKIGGAFTPLITEFTKAYDSFIALFQGMSGGTEIFTILSDGFTVLGEVIGTIIGIAIQPLILTFRGLIEVLSFVTREIVAVLPTAIDFLKEVFNGLRDKIVSIYNDIMKSNFVTFLTDNIAYLIPILMILSSGMVVSAVKAGILAVKMGIVATAEAYAAAKTLLFTTAINAKNFAFGVGNNLLIAGKAIYAAFASGEVLLAAKSAILTAAQWALNMALNANPLGAMTLIVVGAVAVFAALTAGIIYAYKNSETFRATIDGLWESFKNLIGQIGGVINKVLAFFGLLNKEKVDVKVKVGVKADDKSFKEVEAWIGRLSKKSADMSQEEIDKTKEAILQNIVAKQQAKQLTEQETKALKEQLELIKFIGKEEPIDLSKQIAAAKDKMQSFFSMVQDVNIALGKTKILNPIELEKVQQLKEQLATLKDKAKDIKIEVDVKANLENQLEIATQLDNLLQGDVDATKIINVNDIKLKTQEAIIKGLEGGIVSADADKFKGFIDKLNKEKYKIEADLSLSPAEAQEQLQKANQKVIDDLIKSNIIKDKAKLFKAIEILNIEANKKINEELLKEGGKTETNEINKQIRDANLKLQEKILVDAKEIQKRKIDLMTDGVGKELALLEFAYKNELEQHKDNAALKLLITEKFEADKKRIGLKNEINFAKLGMEALKKIDYSNIFKKRNNDFNKSLDIDRNNLSKMLLSNELSYSEYASRLNDIELKRQSETLGHTSLFIQNLNSVLVAGSEQASLIFAEQMRVNAETMVLKLGDVTATGQDVVKNLNDNLGLAFASVGNSAMAMALAGESLLKSLAVGAIKTARIMMNAYIAALLPKANVERPLGLGTIEWAGISILANGLLSVAEASLAGYKDGAINIQGKGTSTSDDIPAMVSRGESVITAKGSMPPNRKWLSLANEGVNIDKAINQLVLQNLERLMGQNNKILKNKQFSNNVNVNNNIEVGNAGISVRIKR